MSTSSLPAGTTLLRVPPLASLRLDPADSSTANAQHILTDALANLLQDHTQLLHFCTGDPELDARRPSPTLALPEPATGAPVTLSRPQIASAARHNAFRPFDHIAYTHSSPPLSTLPTNGLWPITSLINHSCFANCFWFVHPTLNTLVVRTSRAVEPGHELTLAYRNARDSAAVRQAAFGSEHGFTCACPVCLADAKVDKRVRDQREREVEMWNQVAGRGFAGGRQVSSGEMDGMRAWVEAEREREYRPHEVRHVEYLIGCLEWMAVGAGGAVAQIREALRPLDTAEEAREVQMGSAPDPLMDMIKLVRTGAMLSADEGMSEGMSAGREMMDRARGIHSLLFGVEAESGWSFQELVNGRPSTMN